AAGLEFGHRAFAGAETLVATEPGCSPDEHPRGVQLRAHVGEGERDRLVVDDWSAEGLALLRVVQRVLVCRACDAERLGTHGRAGQLEGFHGCLLGACPALAGAREALV